MYETLMALQGRPLNFLHQQVSIGKAVQEMFENSTSVPWSVMRANVTPNIKPFGGML